jgi:riboflavin synthase
MTDTKIIHIPMHEILALVENTITQLSEDNAREFMSDLIENLNEMLPV